MLSPQSKYALRAMMYLAQQGHDIFVKVEDIAVESDLPAPYLAKIFKLLAEQDLIVSKRGKNGGVQLNRCRDSISFYDICEATGDPIVRAECVLFKKLCEPKQPCSFHPKWSRTKQRLLSFLRRTTVG